MTTTTTMDGRMVRGLIGPSGDPGGLTLQWWRDGARVSGPGRRPDGTRRVRGINIGADAISSPIGSATAAAVAGRVEVRVECSPAPSAGGAGPGHGERARRAVPARPARPAGAVRLVGDSGEGAPRVVLGADPESGDGLLVEWEPVGAGPLFESRREAAAGARVPWARMAAEVVGKPADVCTVLGWLGLMPGQPVRAWAGGAVSRAARVVALQHGGRVPSDDSLQDAAADARADVLGWWRVWERRVARWMRRGVWTVSARLLRLAWLRAFRAARRSLRRWGVESAGEEGGREVLRPVTRQTAAAEEWSGERAEGERRRAFAGLVRAARGLGMELPVARGRRAKVRASLRRILSVLRRVVVEESGLVSACAAEDWTVDGLARSARSIGFWPALDAWQGVQARDASRPLRWLGQAAGKLRRARAAVPSSLPQVRGEGGGNWVPRPDARPAGRLPGGRGVLVRPLSPVPGSTPSPDVRVGDASRARRRVRGMDALARLVRAKEEVARAAASARADIAARRELWRTVSAGWREPGRVSGPRRAKG